MFPNIGKMRRIKLTAAKKAIVIDDENRNLL